MPGSDPIEVRFPSDTEILIVRELAAPRHLVYEAWTTPELVKRWWPGGRGVMTSAEIDLRVGGSWRYVMTTDDGAEVAFHGVYRELAPGERIVYTEVYEGRPDAEALTAVQLNEVDGRTMLEILVRYETRRDRDAHRDSMVDGLHAALTLLEQTASAATVTGRPSCGE